MNPESKIHFLDRFRFNILLLLEQIFGRREFLRRRRSALALAIARRLADSMGEPTCAVDRHDSLSSLAFHKNYLLNSRPVVFTGAAKEWPCCQTWTLEYFSKNHGHNDLLIVQSNGLTTRQNTNAHEFLSVQELVANIKSGGDKYLRFSPLLHENPELTEALDMNWLSERRGPGTFGNTYYMFMGGKGQKTLLHADQPCNLYVQVYGEKKWTLFLPGDSACLYPDVASTAYVKSPVNVDAPNLTQYPLYKHARKLEVHLKAGDVLYVPPHVWHHVENLTDTIAVGYRFSSLRVALRSSITFTLLRILSFNPPLWKTRAYGKIDTNLIWAHGAGKGKEVLQQRAARRGREKERLMSVSKLLAPSSEFFLHHPLITILAFCLLHLTASTTGLPGSCTLLNTLAGALFGFWRGCAIVYPLTALGAASMYLLGTRFQSNAQKYADWLEALRKRLKAGDYLFFVGLRLSPLLPFGVLNALMGLLRVPFGFFMVTTLIGIFFDVTVLNALGASLRSEAPVSHRALVLAFALLFGGLYFLRLRIAKAVRA